MQRLAVRLFASQLLWAAGGRAICEQSSSSDPCDSPCIGLTACNQCLAASSCSWCSLPNPRSSNGHGWCTVVESTRRQDSSTLCDMSSYRGSTQSTTSSDRAVWYNASCPAENECENGRHDCDLAVERCADKENGFECQCKDGYSRKNGVCVPACANGCTNGICVQPNVCQCHFGFVGSSCGSACNCFGHSTCPGPQALDTCVKCHNHTMGVHCELCESGYIRRGNSCLSCREYCHNHSDICLSPKSDNLFQTLVTPSPKILTTKTSFDPPGDISGQNSLPVPAICVNCSDFTKGLQCEYCLPGYFRPPKSPREMPCLRCDCNGHSVDNVCNPQRGDGCECHNNTMTPHGCKDDECWMIQCAMCKDSFRGIPVNGRQCYREMNEADQDVCFVPEECSRFKQSRPLQPMELSFFVVTPEFSNVDLRIILDVGQGVLDAFLAVADFFVARYDSAAGCSVLSWQAAGNTVPWRRGDSVRSLFMASVGEPEPCLPGDDGSWALVTLKDASDFLASYITYDSPSSVLVLQNVANRAVIVAPASAFDLKTTRFYLVIRSRRTPSAGAWGNLLYTQDQAHFDLFIFFAVFFAAFFLALSLTLVLWRLKTLHAERRHDRAQTVELLMLAKRPFSSFAVLWKDDEVGECSKYVDAVDPWPFCFQNLRKKPVTVATVLVRMPGGTRAPVRLALASALLLTAPAVKKTEVALATENAAAYDVTKKRSGRRYLPSGRCRVQPC